MNSARNTNGVGRMACTFAAVVGMLAFSHQGMAADRITSDLKTECKSKLNDNEWRSLSLAAGRVLMHADRARQAVADGNADEAKKQIEKGLKLVQIIESVAPKYQVSAEIKSGDLAYKDEDENSADLIPIYDELDKVDLVGPLARAKQEVAKSKEGVGPGRPVVQAAAFEFTSADLDVPTAKTGLLLARTALSKGKNDEADAALGTVLGAVVFNYEVMDLPLVRAADNLKLAELELAEGNHDEAKTALAAASDALKQYEQIAGDSRSMEAKKLHKEIDELAEHLEQNPDQAKDKVAHWWDRLTHWFHG